MPSLRPASAMSATRAGVHTNYNPTPGRAMVTCPRCGHVRSVDPRRGNTRGLCKSCKYVEPNWGEVSYR